MEPQRATWFEARSTDQAKSQVLPPPQNILKTHQQFKKKLRNSLKIDKRDIRIASTKEELEQQIADVQEGVGSRLIAQQALDETSKAQDSYEVARTHGRRRVGRWAQDFAHGFGQFVGAYSGIIDVIRTASGPYGEVAYQTLSIFLVVVVNKTNNDERISDLLDDMRKSFPKLENWKDIYPTEVMRTLVAAAYEQVIDFCRVASEYLTRFFTRLTMAIFSPPSIGVDRTAALIHKTLAEINSEAMYGLHGRSQHIQQTTEELRAEAVSSNERLKELESHNRILLGLLEQHKELLQEQREGFSAYKKEVEERLLQEDKQRLEALEEALGMTLSTSETSVDKAKGCLMKVFPNQPQFVAHLPATGYLQMNRNRLQETDAYQQWTSSIDSCMLLLSGTTSIEGRQYKQLTHSWLSPAAIYIAEDLMKNDVPIAFFSCQSGMESRLVPVKQIISSLVIQILKTQPRILREKAVQFHSFAQSEGWQNTGDTRKQVNVIVNLLGEVLATVKDIGPWYIILDRLDQYEGKFNLLMDELVKLVGGSSCNVKFVVIVDTSIGRGEWHPEYLSGDNIRMDRLFMRKDWNQLKLTNVELRERHLTWKN